MEAIGKLQNLFHVVNMAEIHGAVLTHVNVPSIYSYHGTEFCKYYI